MSNADQLFFPASSDFVKLCQAQTSLLTSALGAVWSAVYLTVESQTNGTKQLLPIVTYPNTETDTRSKRVLARLTESWSQVDENHDLEKVVEDRERDRQILASQRQLKSFARKKQIVLPLIYEDVVMGLLVTKRDDRDWNRQEVGQLEEIARTIAISCTLDRRQGYYRQSLENMQHSIVNERNKIDDLFHQLRNPLTALRTFGKLLIKRLLPEDRNRDIVQNILQQGDRLQDLLQQFQNETNSHSSDIIPITLNAAPIYLGEAEENSNFLLPANSLTAEEIYLADLLYPLIDAAAAIAQEKEIILTAKIPPNLPSVRGNTKALREVFSNLFDNAVKYTPNGGSVEIEAGLSRERDNYRYLGVAIRDTGYGIPLEDRQHLFERNYRGVQAKGDIEGTGLGLAIAKELIEKVGGGIEIVSPNPLIKNDRAIGTIFTVWLKNYTIEF
jgi:signal transduction histidine kinase